MAGPDQEPLEVRAENFLMGFLKVFDTKAQSGLFSKKKNRNLTEDEVVAMRNMVKEKFYELVKFPPEAKLEYAQIFESAPNSPVSQLTFGSINSDVRKDFRIFLTETLRELAKS